MTPEGFWLYLAAMATVFGLLIGSFLNVCIGRMPEDRSVVHPPSHCPTCGAGIRWHDNVPVLSWLLLRGRCRDCGTPISSLYPTIEVLTGLLALLVWMRFVPDVSALGLANVAAFGVHFGVVAMLVVVTFIDLRHHIIPDECSIYALPFGVASALLLTHLGFAEAITWQHSVVGALVGGGSLLAIMGLWWLVRRRESMGLGDVKLLAMLGAFLGLPALLLIILVSSIVGSVVGIAVAVVTRQRLTLQLPFGPFLALGAVVWILHGPALMGAYQGYSQHLFELVFLGS